MTIYRSQQQTAQNRLVANLIEYYVVTDHGQRKDGEGGKRVIVFVGCSRNNPHVLKALEKAKDYWDIIRLAALECHRSTSLFRYTYYDSTRLRMTIKDYILFLMKNSDPPPKAAYWGASGPAWSVLHHYQHPIFIDKKYRTHY